MFHVVNQMIVRQYQDELDLTGLPRRRERERHSSFWLCRPVCRVRTNCKPTSPPVERVVFVDEEEEEDSREKNKLVCGAVMSSATTTRRIETVALRYQLEVQLGKTGLLSPLVHDSSLRNLAKEVTLEFACSKLTTMEQDKQQVFVCLRWISLLDRGGF